jgi:hypothetical protein
MRRIRENLKAQLGSYAAAAKPLIANGGGRLGNWPVYAVATGSALAMATSASASIIYSGPLAISKSIPPVGPSASNAGHGTSIQLKNGPFAYPNSFTFLLRDRHSTGDGPVRNKAYARIGASYGLRFLRSGINLKPLASGAVISGLAGNFGNYGSLHKRYTHGTGTSAPTYNNGIWPNGGVDFAGIKLANGDFGWLKLSWSGANDFPDTINLYGWAVQTDGTAIRAGDTGVSATPEPGTFGLALLATGAAGVLALRRRRQLSK